MQKPQMSRRRAYQRLAEQLEPRTLLAVTSVAGDLVTPVDLSVLQHTEAIASLPGEASGGPDNQPHRGGGGNGDLRISEVLLVDADNNRISTPTLGEEVFVRAEWQSSGLSNGNLYTVRFWVDGVALDSNRISASSGDNLQRSWWRGGWFASPGVHQVRVQIDALTEIAESTESNNVGTLSFVAESPHDLPAKFVSPIGGVQGRDWTIQNVLDVDPKSGFADYRGGTVAYSGHDAIDYSLSNFAAMDRGLDVYAAASGTVIEVHDGEFDRHSTWQTPSPPANRITISHGGGWETSYLHLRKGSIAVSVGDFVSAGSLIGLVGSSGKSSGAHLHFEVRHDGAAVETLFAPHEYWVSPPAYTFDASPSLMDFGISRQAPTYERIQERPTNAVAFSRAGGQRVYAWGIYSALKPGDVIDVQFFSPNENLFYASTRTVNKEHPWSWWYFSTQLPNSPQLGSWRVDWLLNGQTVKQLPFRVGANGQPEGELFIGDTFLIDGRTTAVEFGEAAVDGREPTRKFVLYNRGESNLSIDGIVLPDGYALVAAPRSVVAPQRSTTFSIQLTAQIAGTREGWVRIKTNESDDASYDFRIQGLVTKAVRIAGDINGDSVLNISDIDALYRQIRRGQFVASSDLNRNQRVNQADVTQLVTNLLKSNYGDVNQDGVFDSADLIRVLQQGQYEDLLSLNSRWTSGDWNGDQEFNSNDLIFALQRGAYLSSAEPAARAGTERWIDQLAEILGEDHCPDRAS